MSSVFRFKQFNIDQANCAMKVNTDAVLLGALVSAKDPAHILDVGTGTGVVALMLAQQFTRAFIDAVEIEEKAAVAAARNFAASPFLSRLRSHSSSFQIFFEENPNKKYDLIISNPPFFIDSLKSGNPVKELARHTDNLFFEHLISGSAAHLSGKGSLVLILPLNTAEVVRNISPALGLKIQREVLIRSFSGSVPHRSLLTLGFDSLKQEIRKFVIYKQARVYSDEYAHLLKDFLTIF